MHDRATAADQVSAVLRPLVAAERLIRDIDEPLDRSAPIAYEAALALCEGAEGHGCRGYHAVWQYLRLADVWPSIRIDGPLFVAAAERLATEGPLDQMLVSGSADYSMLAHIAHGAKRGGAAPAVHVLDRCATSLQMNAWYGAERGIAVHTVQTPVMDFQPDGLYDFIATHTFISLQSPDDRPMLFRKWGEWLRPGGRLCFSDRVSDKETPYDPDDRARRVETIARDTLARCAERGIALPCPRDEFVALIHQFGLIHRANQPAMPIETIVSWAEDAGMQLDLAVPVDQALPGAQVQNLIAEQRPDRIRVWFQFRRR